MAAKLMQSNAQDFGTYLLSSTVHTSFSMPWFITALGVCALEMGETIVECTCIERAGVGAICSPRPDFGGPFF